MSADKNPFENYFSPKMCMIIKDKAHTSAMKLGHTGNIWPQDIILAILSEENFSTNILSAIKVNVGDLYSDLSKVSPLEKSEPPKNLSNPNIHEDTQEIINRSKSESEELGHSYIGTEHVVLSFLSYDGKSKQVKEIKILLEKYGVKKQDFKSMILSALDNAVVKKETNKTGSSDKQQQQKKQSNNVEQGLKKENYIENINDRVKGKNEKFIGRDFEINRCTQILCRKKKRNLIIIGESGVGKTSLVEGLANKINQNDVPEKIKGAQIYSVNLSNIVAGTKYRGQFEERMKMVVEFFSDKKTTTEKTVIFVDEIHNLINAGNAEGALDASSIIKPHLSSDTIQCIGTTTFADYRKYIQKDDAFSRRFTTVFLDEPNKKDTFLILKGIKSEYEDYHGIKIHDSVLQDVVDLSDKYIKNKFFPDKALDILDESCVKETINKKNATTLSKETVLEIVSESTGIPISTMSQDEKDSLSKISESVGKIVVGQDKAVDSMCSALQRARAGFKDENKTMGVFLFLGPTGTGKTLLAKTISEYLFGSDRIIRLDMSEYMEPYSVSKIIGSAPGYVGYDDGGQLTERIRKRPYSVILLDEIEKAHKEVLNVFLQIFDEGRLTDSHGRYADFRNSIIIATSNIAAARMDKESKPMGFSLPSNGSTNKKEIEGFLLDQVNSYFAPEFINRIDEILIFQKFEQAEIEKIMMIEAEKVKNRAKEQGYNLRFSPSSKKFLCEKGYSEKFGARPMGRAIKTYIETPLAKKIFSNEIKEGDIVYISHDKANDALTLKTKNQMEEENGTDILTI